MHDFSRLSPITWNGSRHKCIYCIHVYIFRYNNQSCQCHTFIFLLFFSFIPINILKVAIYVSNILFVCDFFLNSVWSTRGINFDISTENFNTYQIAPIIGISFFSITVPRQWHSLFIVGLLDSTFFTSMLRKNSNYNFSSTNQLEQAIKTVCWHQNRK